MPPTRDLESTKAKQEVARGRRHHGRERNRGHHRLLPLSRLPQGGRRRPPAVRGLRAERHQGFGLVDSKGVRMFRFAGETKIWDTRWPSAVRAHQPQLLPSDEDRAYLDIAIANAQRNIDRKVSRRGLTSIRLRLQPCTGTRRDAQGPWYSAMAQGQALLFLRPPRVHQGREVEGRRRRHLRQPPSGARGRPPSRPGSTRAVGSVRGVPPSTANSEHDLNGHIREGVGLLLSSRLRPSRRPEACNWRAPHHHRIPNKQF